TRWRSRKKDNRPRTTGTCYRIFLKSRKSGIFHIPILCVILYSTNSKKQTTMKLLRPGTASALFMIMSLTAGAQIKLNKKALESGSKVVKAATLSDDEVIAYTKEYIEWMDENNPVAPETDALAQRLQKLTSGLNNYDGLDLNFKVYLVRDINA